MASVEVKRLYDLHSGTDNVRSLPKCHGCGAYMNSCSTCGYITTDDVWAPCQCEGVKDNYYCRCSSNYASTAVFADESNNKRITAEGMLDFLLAEISSPGTMSHPQKMPDTPGEYFKDIDSGDIQKAHQQTVVDKYDKMLKQGKVEEVLNDEKHKYHHQFKEIKESRVPTKKRPKHVVTPRVHEEILEVAKREAILEQGVKKIVHKARQINDTEKQLLKAKKNKTPPAVQHALLEEKRKGETELKSVKDNMKNVFSDIKKGKKVDQVKKNSTVDEIVNSEEYNNQVKENVERITENEEEGEVKRDIGESTPVSNGLLNSLGSAALKAGSAVASKGMDFLSSIKDGASSKLKPVDSTVPSPPAPAPAQGNPSLADINSARNRLKKTSKPLEEEKKQADEQIDVAKELLEKDSETIQRVVVAQSEEDDWETGSVDEEQHFEQLGKLVDKVEINHGFSVNDLVDGKDWNRKGARDMLFTLTFTDGIEVDDSAGLTFAINDNKDHFNEVNLKKTSTMELYTPEFGDEPDENIWELLVNGEFDDKNGVEHGGFAILFSHMNLLLKKRIEENPKVDVGSIYKKLRKMTDNQWCLDYGVYIYLTYHSIDRGDKFEIFKSLLNFLGYKPKAVAEDDMVIEAIGNVFIPMSLDWPKYSGKYKTYDQLPKPKEASKHAPPPVHGGSMVELTKEEEGALRAALGKKTAKEISGLIKSHRPGTSGYGISGKKTDLTTTVLQLVKEGHMKKDDILGSSEPPPPPPSPDVAEAALKSKSSPPAPVAEEKKVTLDLDNYSMNALKILAMASMNEEDKLYDLEFGKDNATNKKWLKQMVKPYSSIGDNAYKKNLKITEKNDKGAIKKITDNAIKKLGLKNPKGGRAKWSADAQDDGWGLLYIINLGDEFLKEVDEGEFEIDDDKVKVLRSVLENDLKVDTSGVDDDPYRLLKKFYDEFYSKT